jgi:hypothetical protein
MEPAFPEKPFGFLAGIYISFGLFSFSLLSWIPSCWNDAGPSSFRGGGRQRGEMWDGEKGVYILFRVHYVCTSRVLVSMAKFKLVK